MDKLLQEALDDFEDDDPSPTAAATQSVESPSAPLAAGKALAPVSSAVQATSDGEADNLDESMEATLRALAASAEKLTEDADGDDSQMLAQLLQKLGGELGGGTGGGEGNDQEMAQLLQQLGNLATEVNGPAAAIDSAATSGASTAPSGGGGSSNSSGGGGGGGGTAATQPDGAMDGMLDALVGQLLSKEVMLEPMQHLHAEFPRFLEANESTLSADELERYRRQQDLVGQILAAYKEAPDDTDRVAALMQEMQACGPPPAQIAGPVGDASGCSVS